MKCQQKSCTAFIVHLVRKNRARYTLMLLRQLWWQRNQDGIAALRFQTLQPFERPAPFTSDKEIASEQTRGIDFGRSKEIAPSTTTAPSRESFNLNLSSSRKL
jgi:hypothetical protein